MTHESHESPVLHGDVTVAAMAHIVVSMQASVKVHRGVHGFSLFNFVGAAEWAIRARSGRSDHASDYSTRQDPDVRWVMVRLAESGLVTFKSSGGRAYTASQVPTDGHVHLASGKDFDKAVAKLVLAGILPHDFANTLAPLKPASDMLLGEVFNRATRQKDQTNV